jgi:hypothetical protein
MRCVHCGCALEPWDAHNLLWGECDDCRDWQAYLWQQRPPPLVDVAAVALRQGIADATYEGLAPYQGGKAV